MFVVTYLGHLNKPQHLNTLKSDLMLLLNGALGFFCEITKYWEVFQKEIVFGSVCLQSASCKNIPKAESCVRLEEIASPNKACQ